MTRWEYYRGFNMQVSQLDELGQDGWEVVGLAQDTDGDLLFILKRPVHERSDG